MSPFLYVHEFFNMALLTIFIYPCYICVCMQNKQYPRDSAKDALCKGRVRVQLKNSDGKPVNSSLTSSKLLFLFLHSNFM